MEVILAGLVGFLLGDLVWYVTHQGESIIFGEIARWLKTL